MLVGTSLAVGFGLAAWLQPDSRGLGTHQQLGLPPCSLRVLAGWRCPSCGMTTSWAYLVRGRFVAAAGSNTGGALLGTMALAVMPWTLASGLRGRWIGMRPSQGAAAFALGVVACVAVLDWIWRLSVP